MLRNDKGTGRLDAVIYGAESVLVSFAGFGGFGVGVLFAEVGVVPFFHRDHGVVGSGQRFFGANGGDPFVGGLLVGETELVEIGRGHGWQE